MAKKPPKEAVPTNAPEMDPMILVVRGIRVVLAADLAAAYGVETKRLNEQVRRNLKRFPDDFMFQLTRDELDRLLDRGAIDLKARADIDAASRSQSATLKRGKNIKYLPYAFTEHGAIMAAMLLNSPHAVAMSTYVVRAFVRQRELLLSNESILRRLAEIDKTLFEHDRGLRTIWSKLQHLLLPQDPPKKNKIGFRK